jgi:hypothetical protein
MMQPSAAQRIVFGAVRSYLSTRFVMLLNISFPRHVRRTTECEVFHQRNIPRARARVCVCGGGGAGFLC